MMIPNEDWVTTAMSDDALVVNLLLRLKNAVSQNHQTLPFTWGIRQPRSRLASASRCDAAVSTRCSPTTPLSWSGGASPSATADGCEDSSRNHAARSKATATSGYTGNPASTKKCRKKKTFAELKEEESSLLKERTYLEKEIAYANANFEAQRAKNESLKRMKLDYGSKSQNNASSAYGEQQCTPSGQPHKRILLLPAIGSLSHATQDETHSQQASESSPTEETSFVIPDLNMMPDLNMVPDEN